MSRKLFEIDDEIRELLDNLEIDDDGCIAPEDMEKLSELNEEREKKLENVTLYYKELVREAEDLKAEADILEKRAKQAEKQAEGLKMYLSSALGGEAFKTARVAVTFRKSSKVIIDENLLNEKYFKEKITYSPDRERIKELLKLGECISGAYIRETNNIQIK